MSGGLEVRIDGYLVAPEHVEEWEIRRARSVLPKLRRLLGLEVVDPSRSNDLVQLRTELLRLKEQCGRQRLREALRTEIRISGFVTKLVLALSGSRRKQCVTEVRVAGCSAKQISDAIHDLMRSDTQANRQSNLLACPDHYVLEARGDTLEVIETTGGSPFPAQFFMRFGDESGLKTPSAPAYGYQSAGTARMSDGTVIGGVRHQFRDEADGALAKLMVEFPAATPRRMIREHQWHLACEFSHWLEQARTAARAP